MKYFSDPAKLEALLGSLLEGTGNTLLLFGITIVLSIPLGFFICMGSMNKKVAPVRWLSRLYVLLLRGTPLMLQVMFVYFGLNLLGAGINRFIAGILAFTLNYAAYFSEIFRGGIQSIEIGQHEAARVLGLTRGQTTRRIVLPQMFKRVIPAMGNEVINLVKDTALVSAIAVDDLMRLASSAVTRDADVTPFVIAALFYLIMNAVVTRIMAMIEKRFAYYR